MFRRTSFARLREEGYATLPFSELVPDATLGPSSTRTRRASSRTRKQASRPRKGGTEIRAEAAGPARSSSCASTRGASQLGLDDPWLRSAPNTAARRRQRVSRDVVEARVRRRLVHAAGRRGRSASRRSAGTATSTTGTCSRPSSISSTSTRRRPVRVRAAQRARRRARRASGRGGRLARTIRRTTSSPRRSTAVGDVHRAERHDHLLQHAGFHRGGFATGKTRVLATFTWESPASLKALSERNYTFVSANGAQLNAASSTRSRTFSSTKARASTRPPDRERRSCSSRLRDTLEGCSAAVA